MRYVSGPPESSLAAGQPSVTAGGLVCVCAVGADGVDGGMKSALGAPPSSALQSTVPARASDVALLNALSDPRRPVGPEGAGLPAGQRGIVDEHEVEED